MHCPQPEGVKLVKIFIQHLFISHILLLPVMLPDQFFQDAIEFEWGNSLDYLPAG